MKIKGTKKIKKLASAILMTSMAVTAAGCMVQFSEQDKKETTATVETQEEQKEEETEKASESATESASESKTEESSEIIETGVVESGDETVVLIGVENKETQAEEEHDQAWIESQLAEGNIDNCSFTFEDAGEDKELITSWATYRVKKSPNEGKIFITIDDESYELDISSDWTGTRFGKTYLLKSNGNTYIYVLSHLEGDRTDVNVYKVDDKGVSYVDTVEKLFIFSDMNYPWEFLCEHYGEMNGALDFYQYYTVGSNGIPVPSEDPIYVTSSVEQVTLAEERTGKLVMYGQITDQDILVSADELIRPSETDFKTYIEVMDKDGNFISFDCVDWFASFEDSDIGHKEAVYKFFDYNF